MQKRQRNEILEESITPENSDNEDEKINDINILKEKDLIDKETWYNY